MTRNILQFLVPRTIARQVVLLVVVSVVLFHLAMTAAMQLARSSPDERRPRPDVDRFVEFVRVLDAMPADERASAAAAMARAYPRLGLRLSESPERAAPHVKRPPGLGDLRRQFGPDLPVFTPAAETTDAARGRGHYVGVMLRDGTAVTGLLPLGIINGPPPGRLILGTIGFMVLNLAVLLWWAMRGLTKPLARFAQAAESFSLDRDAASLPENKGPHEVRVASRALNRMQTRIRRMVEDRTRMLAAVSHDLRTPITRLRLRAEFVEDADTRRHMLRDLDQMGAMTHAALSYLRDGQEPRDRALIDLASLLQTICNDFADSGEPVSYLGPDHLLAQSRADDIKRAVTNLIENALKYSGTSAVVTLRPASRTDVEIEVIDRGPGIPDDRKAAMLEPFARGDEARTQDGDAAGFGLGLAIARSVAENHGGALALRDMQPSGLIASLRLPIKADEGEGPATPG